MFKQTIEGIDKNFMKTYKSKNPYDYINKKTHKIEILPGMPYISTSNVDVFEIRNQKCDQTALQEANKFIKANIEIDQEQSKI